MPVYKYVGLGVHDHRHPDGTRTRHSRNDNPYLETDEDMVEKWGPTWELQHGPANVVKAKAKAKPAEAAEEPEPETIPESVEVETEADFFQDESKPEKKVKKGKKK